MISALNRLQPTVIDLFSGAGGTGHGFKKAGFWILAAVEIDQYAAQTYEHNLGIGVIETDISLLSPRKFRRSLGLETGELDVLVGCPPCQGFTRMRNEAGSHDTRNDLVLKYLKYVRELQPRFAVFENVPGIIRTSHGKRYFDKLCTGLRRIKGSSGLPYHVTFKEVDAADYGVPQHRKRVIVVAGRDGEEPPFPLPSHGDPHSSAVQSGWLSPWATVGDVLREYPKLSAGQSGENGALYPNHIAPATGKKVLSFIRLVPQDGGSRTDVATEYWLDCHLEHSGHRDVYGRIAWDKPANVITSGCTNPSKGRFVHPEQDRALTAREAARLQGFPDDFVFFGKNISTQIGNAVPPPLAYKIAQALLMRLQLSQVIDIPQLEMIPTN